MLVPRNLHSSITVPTANETTKLGFSIAEPHMLKMKVWTML